MTTRKFNLLKEILSNGFRCKKANGIKPTVHDLRYELETLMLDACRLAYNDIDNIGIVDDNGFVLPRHISCLFNVVTTIHLYREIKKQTDGDKKESVDSLKQLRFWFKAYAQVSDICMRTNITIKKAVQLHIGPDAYHTWSMLESLGYSPFEEDFWVELRGCLAAHTADELPTVDFTNFSGA